jgi:hypothetical protein
MPIDETILLDRQLKYWLKDITIVAEAKAVSLNEKHVSKSEQKSVKINLIPFIPLSVLVIIYIQTHAEKLC